MNTPIRTSPMDPDAHLQDSPYVEAIESSGLDLPVSSQVAEEIARAEGLFAQAERMRLGAGKQYSDVEASLREKLLALQAQLRDSGFNVLVLVAGVDGAGKGDLANLLNSWMDARGIVTRAYGDLSDEESERPEFWRYWRDLPAHGQIGVFLSAWYSRPLLDHVYGVSSPEELGRQIEEIRALERTLANDGTLILKFWMHLGYAAQKQRLEVLEGDPLSRWRVSRKDWEHWTMYDRFVRTGARLIQGTNTDEAPWHIIDGSDWQLRSLAVGRTIRRALRDRLKSGDSSSSVEKNQLDNGLQESRRKRRVVSVLSALDLSQTIERANYKKELKRLQGRLNRLHRLARERGRSTILVFEGWDAGGKGGAIRRIVPALDMRDVRIISVAAPTDEENQHHYLWRFWRHLSRAGKLTIFDRSWYGRVLVERVEGFASPEEWSRAYDEINEFESALTDSGIIVAKFWLHISPEEQDRRFRARELVPYKRWKLTEEDWRNREQWDAYEEAVDDMVRLTDRPNAPWILVEGNDKRFARVKVLQSLCTVMEEALGER